MDFLYSRLSARAALLILAWILIGSGAGGYAERALLGRDIIAITPPLVILSTAWLAPYLMRRFPAKSETDSDDAP